MMKNIGYLMITLGFLAGALTAVVDKEQIRWDYFALALIAGAAGVALVRTSGKMENRHEGKLASNMQAVETSLDRIVKNMTGLNAEKASINTYDVRHRIDELFTDDLNTFVEARESIAHAHSLNAYADVMSSFAAGERYLNRVWSASTDGYVDEVNTYLDRAQGQFAESHQKVCQLKANTPPPV
ncbi:MAG TPA: hypothetical protein ENI81_13125 [Phycisphaerales bacterium]|nr:hypothetical protein [Phycisphaerales bacterium]